MNTKGKQDQKDKASRTQQQNGQKKRDRNVRHEQELPETRLTR